MKFKDYVKESNIDRQTQNDFQDYADEIAEKLSKAVKINWDDEGEVKKLQWTLDSCFLAMKLSDQPTNPNYTRYKQFLPDKFEMKYFSTEGGGDLNKVPWFSMTDAQHYTIFRRAVMDLAKKNGITLKNSALIH